MDFSEALAAMKQGKKIRRNKWYFKGYCIELSDDDNCLLHHQSDGNELYPSLAVKDILADDWEIVN